MVFRDAFRFFRSDAGGSLGERGPPRPPGLARFLGGLTVGFFLVGTSLAPAAEPSALPFGAVAVVVTNLAEYFSGVEVALAVRFMGNIDRVPGGCGCVELCPPYLGNLSARCCAVVSH